MYYVNRNEIDRKLAFIPTIIAAIEPLTSESIMTTTNAFVQERALHLAIEVITDIGSLMIDGFVMRDASSYEDIVEILHGENVFNDRLTVDLVNLVKQRKPLVQDYIEFQRTQIDELTEKLPKVLEQFSEAVTKYLDAELGT